ncbi:MAG TPA: hypothetical protein VF169_28240 [Albitalea sp.]|uniref:hypothetical protein n=1 Tax=Piscinibacter sp. TaxID=1903157 RepID=UPI002ED0ADD9
MSMQPITRNLLEFLHKNPGVRARIRAPANKTLLYAGSFFKPMWQEIADMKRAVPQLRDKVTLTEVLAGIPLHGEPFAHLLAWVERVNDVQPWRDNGFVAWRALSGIFASNAVGAVSFQVGGGISKEAKVFAATEIAVLSRNPNVDAVSKDMLGYYQRCLELQQPSMNAGFIAA